MNNKKFKPVLKGLISKHLESKGVLYGPFGPATLYVSECEYTGRFHVVNHYEEPRETHEGYVGEISPFGVDFTLGVISLTADQLRG